MTATDTNSGNLAAVESIPLTLRAELDRRTITFRELLAIGVDSVVLLSRPAGENVDLYAGEVYIGNGEILVVDSMLAVRLADIGDSLSPAPSARAEQKGKQ